MVELIEYVIVFGISVGLAGAAVMILQGAAPGIDQVAEASASDQIAGAARLAAVEGGNATLVLPLDDAAVSCSAGSLLISSGGTSRAYQVGYPCEFDYAELDGECTLVFSAASASLQLSVDC